LADAGCSILDTGCVGIQFGLHLKFPILKISPTNTLRQAHRTFITGEESPLPGGFEKGDGNASPEAMA
jgi:hypothetical protein